jgi:hypothetical protein
VTIRIKSRTHRYLAIYAFAYDNIKYDAGGDRELGSRSGTRNRKNNVAPRIGVAFDPTGSGKTSIPAGFGITYDVKFQNFASITLPPQLQSELNPQSACAPNPQPTWCSAPNGVGFLQGGVLLTLRWRTKLRPRSDHQLRRPTVMPKILTCLAFSASCIGMQLSKYAISIRVV